MTMPEHVLPTGEPSVHARVLAVDGVAQIFPPDAVAGVVRAADAVAGGLARAVSRPRASGQGADVRVRIATREDGATPRAAREVADVLVRELDESGRSTVTVRIASIQPSVG